MISSAQRSRISKRAWRMRKREGGKGRCVFCGKPIYAGGVVYNNRKWHKGCLEAYKYGLTKKQAGVANPRHRPRNSYLFYGARELNPRPPAAWWSRMRARTAAGYPRKVGETLKHWKADISRITGGIWYNFSEATRKRLIRKYEGIAVPARALNPIRRRIVYQNDETFRIGDEIKSNSRKGIVVGSSEQSDCIIVAFSPNWIPTTIHTSRLDKTGKIRTQDLWRLGDIWRNPRIKDMAVPSKALANVLQCPKCGNPVSVNRSNVYLKCPNCGASLVKVNVRRR